MFLCSGSEGYIPKYNPGNSEYGCLADSHTLMYRFKVIVSSRSHRFWFHLFYFKDKEQPDTEDNSLNSVPFNAVLAVDDPAATRLAEQPGADGFRMDSTPLFQVSSSNFSSISKKTKRSTSALNGTCTRSTRCVLQQSVSDGTRSCAEQPQKISASDLTEEQT